MRRVIAIFCCCALTTAIVAQNAAPTSTPIAPSESQIYDYTYTAPWLRFYSDKRMEDLRRELQAARDSTRQTNDSLRDMQRQLSQQIAQLTQVNRDLGESLSTQRRQRDNYRTALLQAITLMRSYEAELSRGGRPSVLSTSFSTLLEQVLALGSEGGSAPPTRPTVNPGAPQRVVKYYIWSNIKTPSRGVATVIKLFKPAKLGVYIVETAAPVRGATLYGTVVASNPIEPFMLPSATVEIETKSRDKGQYVWEAIATDAPATGQYVELNLAFAGADAKPLLLQLSVDRGNWLARNARRLQRFAKLPSVALAVSAISLLFTLLVNTDTGMRVFKGWRRQRAPLDDLKLESQG